MASSFRIRLKVPPNANAPQQSEDDETGTNSSPLGSSPQKARDSSIVDDRSSMMSEDAAEEEDELEDSPPPQPASFNSSSRMKTSAAHKVGTGRKLSGAAAMKAANSLKRKMAAGENMPAPATGEGSSSSTRSSSGKYALPDVSTINANLPPGSQLAAARARVIEEMSKYKKRSFLADLPKPIETMSLEEIEALPAAKRRKGLKARGASGPGRGWRKGLKMDQKPVYRQPGDSSPTAIAPGTPSSFARPKSSLARDALSKSSTPFRSESPYSYGSADSDIGTPDKDDGTASPARAAASRTFSATHAAVAARRARAAAEEPGSVSLPSISTSYPRQAEAAHVQRNANPTKEEEGRAIKAIIRGAPLVLPPPKIPIGFVTAAPLDRSGTRRPVRKWSRRGREVLSLGGRVWSAMSWISEEKSASNKAASVAAAVAAANGTEGGAVTPAAPTAAATAPGTATGTGEATPAMTSRVASPTQSNRTVEGAKASAAMLKASSATSSPSSAARNAPAAPEPGATPGATAWKGSSAAFAAAAVRGRNA